MKRNKKVTFLKQRSYVIAAVLMVVAVLGMTGVYFSEQLGEKKQQDLQAKQEEQDAQAEETAKAEEEETAQVEQIITPENNKVTDKKAQMTPRDSEEEKKAEEELEEDTNATSEEQPEEVEESALVQEQEEPSFTADTDLIWPLQGNVILNYSMDQTIYFATLDQYKYNPAIVIQGNVNDKVTSVAAGQVTGIETNEVTGYTVTVDLGNGYSAVYGQLKEVPLEKGNYIESGETIGYVNEPTKYFSVEGPNLYFQLLKDNESINPMEYLE